MAVEPILTRLAAAGLLPLVGVNSLFSQRYNVGVDSIEKRVAGLLSEIRNVVGNRRLDSLLGTAMESAMRTKANVDRNIDSLLALANLPSRGDYRKLQTRLDVVQGSLRNLSHRLDELSQGLDGNSAKGAGSKKRAVAKSKAASPAKKRAASAASSASGAARRGSKSGAAAKGKRARA